MTRSDIQSDVPHTPLDAVLLDFNALSPSHKFCSKAHLRRHKAQIAPYYPCTFASHKWLIETSLGVSGVTGIVCDRGEHTIACCSAPLRSGSESPFLIFGLKPTDPSNTTESGHVADSMGNITPLLFPWLLHKLSDFCLPCIIQKFFRLLSTGFLWLFASGFQLNHDNAFTTHPLSGCICCNTTALSLKQHKLMWLCHIPSD